LIPSRSLFPWRRRGLQGHPTRGQGTPTIRSQPGRKARGTSTGRGHPQADSRSREKLQRKMLMKVVRKVVRKELRKVVRK
jgi:hypothetical protein